MKIDLLIKNGIIFDGTGREPFESDIGISGDRIAFIGKRSEDISGAEKIIEAKDMAVAPGFIDSHAHSELSLLADPLAEGKICQGITTEINGNCGLSAAPLYGDARKQRESDLSEYGIRERWTTLQEYFEILNKKDLSVNFATLVGHGNMRACVEGFKDRKLEPREMAEMKTLLRQALQHGAIGISTGLIYPPGVYSDTEELIEIAASCKDHIYTSHMRSEGDELIEAVREIIRIGDAAGIKVHISHIKTSGEKNWTKIDRVLSMIEEARRDGGKVTCDRYPYTAASTDLDSVLPDWTYEGGSERELQRLRNPAVVRKIKEEIEHIHPDRMYWKNVFISTVVHEKSRWMEGKSIEEIADEKNSDPIDTLLTVLIENQLKVGAIFASMSEDNLIRFLMLPYVMLGSDSTARSCIGVTCKGKPHPRGFGSFPRFLGKYIRDDRLMPLHQAVHKITLLPARTFGLEGRGILEEGSYADIVIFDPQHIIDRATYDTPFLKPRGVSYVLVNGVPAIWEGRLTGARTGRILRHGR